MTVDPDRARQLADLLNAEHLAGRSWRKIARDYPGVAPGTLCRIAKSAGAYLPKSKRILRLLGLLERKKQTRMQKAISKMARETRKAVIKKQKVTGT